MTDPTRQRLLFAALRLFAEQGFNRTTVGQIEAAAGLTARGGASYKHFPSKAALLEAAVDHALFEVVTTRARVFDLLPLDDFRSEVTILLRWLLIELEREREITAIFEKDGDAFPWIAERFYRDVAEPGFRAAADFLTERLNEAGGREWDTEAVAAIAVGAVVNYRRTEWNFSRAPLDVGEHRLIGTLADVLAGLSLAGDASP